MMKLQKNTKNDICTEIYDLCIIDGPKNWTIDGAAFFFVDKPLQEGGHIIFNDYNWKYAQAENKRDSTDGITHRSLSQQERQIPHIQEVFELLVKQHPNYGALTLFDIRDWAMAEKCRSQDKTYSVVYRQDLVHKVFKKISKLWRQK